MSFEITKFNMSGYKFDDWSLVKELYVPTDVSSGTDRSLHVRGREALPHHLQHYVIPYGKVFIAFAITNVKMTTTEAMGLFGTGKAYGRYPESHQQPGDDDPGAPFAWSSTYFWLGNYYYNGSTWGSLVIHNGRIYECCQTHAPSSDPAKEPSPAGDTAYWLKGSVWDVYWESGKFYFFNELELVEVEGFTGAYMCMVDHTSSSANKPCDGSWDDIWNAGDEFNADLSSNFGFSKPCLNVSEGTTNPFSHDIIAVFVRNVENRLRRIDAMTDTGTMKAGAVLYGIEVDA